MNLAEEVGRKIREAREAKGWTQVGLSWMLKDRYGIQVSDSLISALEKGNASSRGKGPIALDHINEILGVKGYEAVQADPSPNAAPSTQGMTDALERMRHELGLFNRGIAAVRVEQGMGQALADLHTGMGNMHKWLELLLSLMDSMEKMVASLFCQDEPNES